MDGATFGYSRSVQVHLCGVRGSMPATGRDFVRVGGNTSCVAIAADGESPHLVLDAGTGLRNLSQFLGEVPFTGTIVLGHLHWDHLMGLPFFAAGDRPDAFVKLLLPEQGIDPLDVLTRIMAPPLFPITPGQLEGSWKFGTYDEGCFEVEGFTVIAREIPHKGGRTMGLRVSDGTSSIAYLSDHAPHDLGPGRDGLGELHPAAVELAADVDLLIHDSQYTSEELLTRGAWGHAAAEYAVALAEACRVRRLLLFHHDPSRTDDQVEALRDKLAVGSTVSLDAAVEGSIIQL